MTTGGRFAVDTRVAAIEAAQNVVLASLTDWLRSPSKETRLKLEASLMDCDDALDRMLGPRGVFSRTSPRRKPTGRPPGRPPNKVSVENDAA